MRDFSVSTESTASPLENPLRMSAPLAESYQERNSYVPGKSNHALSKPDLAQLLVFLLAYVARILGGVTIDLGGRLRGLRIVEHDLVLELLVRRTEGGIVYGEKGQLRGEHPRDQGGRHLRLRHD